MYVALNHVWKDNIEICVNFELMHVHKSSKLGEGN